VARPAPTNPGPDARYTSERYFRLVSEGVLEPDDRLELLEGVIVAMAPQGTRHAAVTSGVSEALAEAIGQRAAIRVQMPFLAGRYSVPEPDVAVVPGRWQDYLDRYPTAAFLVVEVADTSLLQDRITKAEIYAAADIPEYWLVNLRDERIEIFRLPDRGSRKYTVTSVAVRGERIALSALPDASVAVDDLLP